MNNNNNKTIGVIVLALMSQFCMDGAVGSLGTTVSKATLGTVTDSRFGVLDMGCEGVVTAEQKVREGSNTVTKTIEVDIENSSTENILGVATAGNKLSKNIKVTMVKDPETNVAHYFLTASLTQPNSAFMNVTDLTQVPGINGAETVSYSLKLINGNSCVHVTGQLGPKGIGFQLGTGPRPVFKVYTNLDNIGTDPLVPFDVKAYTKSAAGQDQVPGSILTQVAAVYSMMQAIIHRNAGPEVAIVKAATDTADSPLGLLIGCASSTTDTYDSMIDLINRSQTQTKDRRFADITDAAGNVTIDSVLFQPNAVFPTLPAAQITTEARRLLNAMSKAGYGQLPGLVAAAVDMGSLAPVGTSTIEVDPLYGCRGTFPAIPTHSNGLFFGANGVFTALKSGKPITNAEVKYDPNGATEPCFATSAPADKGQYFASGKAIVVGAGNSLVTAAAIPTQALNVNIKTKQTIGGVNIDLLDTYTSIVDALTKPVTVKLDIPVSSTVEKFSKDLQKSVADAVQSKSTDPLGFNPDGASETLAKISSDTDVATEVTNVKYGCPAGTIVVIALYNPADKTWIKEVYESQDTFSVVFNKDGQPISVNTKNALLFNSNDSAFLEFLKGSLSPSVLAEQAVAKAVAEIAALGLPTGTKDEMIKSIKAAAEASAAQAQAKEQAKVAFDTLVSQLLNSGADVKVLGKLVGLTAAEIAKAYNEDQASKTPNFPAQKVEDFVNAVLKYVEFLGLTPSAAPAATTTGATTGATGTADKPAGATTGATGATPPADKPAGATGTGAATGATGTTPPATGSTDDDDDDVAPNATGATATTPAVPTTGTTAAATGTTSSTKAAPKGSKLVSELSPEIQTLILNAYPKAKYAIVGNNPRVSVFNENSERLGGLAVSASAKAGIKTTPAVK